MQQVTRFNQNAILAFGHLLKSKLILHLNEQITVSEHSELLQKIPNIQNIEKFTRESSLLFKCSVSGGLEITGLNANYTIYTTIIDISKEKNGYTNRKGIELMTNFPFQKNFIDIVGQYSTPVIHTCNNTCISSECKYSAYDSASYYCHICKESSHGCRRSFRNGNVWCNSCYGEFNCGHLKKLMPNKITLSEIDINSIVFVEKHTQPVRWDDPNGLNSVIENSIFALYYISKIDKLNKELCQNKLMNIDTEQLESELKEQHEHLDRLTNTCYSIDTYNSVIDRAKEEFSKILSKEEYGNAVPRSYVLLT